MKKTACQELTTTEGSINLPDAAGEGVIIIQLIRRMWRLMGKRPLQLCIPMIIPVM